MSTLNRFECIGRIGRDAETRYTNDGKAVASFSVAVSEKQRGGEEHTEWVACSAFERLAEIVGEYGKKGRQVYVAGRLRTRKFQDRDGREQQRTEIRVSEFQLLGDRPRDDQAGASAPPPQRQSGTRQAPQRQHDDGYGDSDIPF